MQQELPGVRTPGWAGGRAALLAADLAQSTLPVLDPAALTSKEFTFDRPVLLQVDCVLDVAESAHSQLEGYRARHDANAQWEATRQEPEEPADHHRPSAKRCLKLRMTDGHTLIKGMEYRFCPALSREMLPGTKILLRAGTRVRRGIALLCPEQVDVLGGGDLATNGSQFYEKTLKSLFAYV